MLVERTERDLAKVPPWLAESALAGLALSMAACIDDRKGSPSECGKVLREVLRDLRELAPETAEVDDIDDLAARRAKRRAAAT